MAAASHDALAALLCRPAAARSTPGTPRCSPRSQRATPRPGAYGNRYTAGDPSWTPYCDTPPVADYPSTHSVLGAAAAAVLARQFGDRTPFPIDSSSLPGVTRSFDSFSQAALENANSRVYCGMHWRSSTRAGVEQGHRIGEFVFDTQLAPTCHE